VGEEEVKEQEEQQQVEVGEQQQAAPPSSQAPQNDDLLTNIPELPNSLGAEKAHNDEAPSREDLEKMTSDAFLWAEDVVEENCELQNTIKQLEEQNANPEGSSSEWEFQMAIRRIEAVNPMLTPF